MSQRYSTLSAANSLRLCKTVKLYVPHRLTSVTKRPVYMCDLQSLLHGRFIAPAIYTIPFDLVSQIRLRRTSSGMRNLLRSLGDLLFFSTHQQNDDALKVSPMQLT